MASSTRKRKRRLGKGLESLLAKPVEVEPPAAAPNDQIDSPDTTNNDDVSESSVDGSHSEVMSANPTDHEGLTYLATELIVPNPKQPRQVFDEEGLMALADSMKTAGLMQPIVVRPRAGEETFELVAGERRWRAAQLAGLQQIPSLVRELDDKASAEWSLIENLQREDLNPIDRAEAFDRLVVDFEVTQKEIATQLGIDRSSVANLLRLNDLESSIKDAVRDGRLSMGHAKVLLSIPDASTSIKIARTCAREQWSVRELERQLKKRSSKSSEAKPADPDARTMYMENLSTQLGDHLGTKVTIVAGKKQGSGKISLSFYSNEQFEGILERLDFKANS
jgi:ParB family chromosome partitioning protein